MIKRRGMRKETIKRAKEVATYMILTGATIRAAAKAFNVSKSTIHIDISIRLKTISLELYNKVSIIILRNKTDRAKRGGAATKEKYEKLRLEGLY